MQDRIHDTDEGWLKTLQVHSWQAELLISGLLIAGLFRLPALFNQWLTSFIVTSSETGYYFYWMAGLMINVAILVIIFFFGFHLFFRTIWIALLGLNSAYPDGIDENSTQGSGPEYWKRMKVRFPNLEAYIIELDRFCSSLFSIGITFAIFCISFSLFTMFLYLMTMLAIKLFPGIRAYLLYIFIAIYILYVLVFGVLAYLVKKKPENKRLMDIQERFTLAINRGFFLFIFYKPLSYMTNILTSNSKSKYGMLIVIIISVFAGAIGSYSVRDNLSIDAFRGDSYYSFNNKENKMLKHNYENLLPENEQIFTPIIQSDIIMDDYVKLFIPEIEREIPHMNLIDKSIFQLIKMSDTERDSIKSINHQKKIDFITIKINGQLIDNLSFRKYEHHNMGEEGLLTYIPATHLRPGENTLTIEKDYFSEDGNQKVTFIPFVYGRK